MILQLVGFLCVGVTAEDFIDTGTESNKIESKMNKLQAEIARVTGARLNKVFYITFIFWCIVSLYA